ALEAQCACTTGETGVADSPTSGTASERKDSCNLLVVSLYLSQMEADRTPGSPWNKEDSCRQRLMVRLLLNVQVHTASSISLAPPSSRLVISGRRRRSIFKPHALISQNLNLSKPHRWCNPLPSSLTFVESPTHRSKDRRRRATINPQSSPRNGNLRRKYSKVDDFAKVFNESVMIVDSAYEILLREVLYDATIIPEYPFLKLQFRTERSATDLRTICLNWLFVVDNDFYFDYEEVDRDDDLNSEYPCSFCQEEFDLVELCCHIDDEHPLKANFRVTCGCATGVGAAFRALVGGVLFAQEEIVFCSRYGADSDTESSKETSNDGSSHSGVEKKRKTRSCLKLSLRSLSQFKLDQNAISV
uniref:Di19 zinc-binding domain-containing protein n=1 Tax=Cucumis melo TaxID=3656 RepID=A0A9I9E9W9_CUCME